jgi:hypothetical protein
MKNLIYFLTAALLTACFSMTVQKANAQTPQKFSIQALIRDNNDLLLINQKIGIQISILQGSVNGTVVYTETQAPTTNSNGLISIEIGGGAGFDAIDWASGPYYIKTETDPTGGSSYTITGTMQLLSVPYALYAATSGTPGTTGPQGPTGANGTSVVLKGSAATVALLPTGALAGDLYVVLEDGNGYVSDGADNWANVGAIQGPAGANGAVGATGSQGTAGTNGIDGVAGANGTNGLDGASGPEGPAGANGINGTDGLIGATGPQGPAGTDGTNGIDGVAGTNGTDGLIGATGQQGPTGANGTSVVLKGSAATVALLPTGALAGDLYVVLEDGNGYVSDGADNWANVGAIQGPAGTNGTNGIDGVTGATGVQGTTGADGSNGTDGATGPQGPAGVDGTNGIDGVAGTNGTNGADGATGPQGTAGTDGANGNDGAMGPTGPQGKTGTDGSNGIDGATGATGLQGPTGADGLLTAPYASYIDTTDQVTVNATTAYPITFNVNDAQYGFTHTIGTSAITATYTGKYLITFSAVVQSSSPYKTFNIWLRIDGTDYPMSNTIFQLLGTAQNRIVTVTYIVPLTAGQNFELVMQSDDTGGKIDYTTHQYSPERPVCPSIILTVNKISE